MKDTFTREELEMEFRKLASDYAYKASQYEKMTYEGFCRRNCFDPEFGDHQEMYQNIIRAYWDQANKYLDIASDIATGWILGDKNKIKL